MVLLIWWNGRHDRLKICCLVIGVRVQVPPFPNNFYSTFKKESSGFTSEIVVNEILEYWSDEINQTNLN